MLQSPVSLFNQPYLKSANSTLSNTIQPLLANDQFTIEPMIFESALNTTADDQCGDIVPHQVMLLFDDHTFDDDRIVHVQKEFEKQFKGPLPPATPPLTRELLSMKVEPLNPEVDIFASMRNLHRSQSPFEKLLELNSGKAGSNRSTQQLHSYAEPRYEDGVGGWAGAQIQRELINLQSHQKRKARRPQSMHRHTRAASDAFSTQGPGLQAQAMRLNPNLHGDPSRMFENASDVNPDQDKHGPKQRMKKPRNYKIFDSADEHQGNYSPSK